MKKLFRLLLLIANTPDFHTIMHFPTVVALGLALIQSSYAAPAVTAGGALSNRDVDQLPPGDELIECRRFRGFSESHLPLKAQTMRFSQG